MTSDTTSMTSADGTGTDQLIPEQINQPVSCSQVLQEVDATDAPETDPEEEINVSDSDGPASSRRKSSSHGSRLIPQSLTLSPGSVNNDPVVMVEVDGKIFEIPFTIVRGSSFQKSHLGTLLNGRALPDGTTAKQWNRKGVAVVEIRSQRLTADMFSYLVDHLCGREPLYSVDLQEVTSLFVKLVAEAVAWKLPTEAIKFPHRLWTATRWTDMSAFFCLTKPEVESTKFKPCAVQLMDNSPPVPIHTYDLVTDKSVWCNWLSQMSVDMFPTDKILQWYQDGEFTLILLSQPSGASTHAPAQTAQPSGGLFASAAKPTVSATGDNNDEESVADNTQPGEISGPTVRTICIHIPHQPNRLVMYDIPNTVEKVGLPGLGFPHRIVKTDRVQIFLSTTFGLEVRENRDVGCQRSSWRVTQILNTDRIAAANSAAAASMGTMANWLRPAGKKNYDWCCVHPKASLKLKYKSAETAGLKDFAAAGDISVVRFYSWGALFVKSKLDLNGSSFALLLIEDVILNRIYGATVPVFLKVPAGVTLNRSNIDVAVSGDMDTVFLIVGGVLLSQTVSPTTSRVEFEWTPTIAALSSSGQIMVKTKTTKGSTQPMAIRVLEGAPLGKNLGSLYAAGIVGEFIPETGVYYRSPICEPLLTELAK